MANKTSEKSLDYTIYYLLFIFLNLKEKHFY